MPWQLPRESREPTTEAQDRQDAMIDDIIGMAGNEIRNPKVGVSVIF